MSRVVRSFMMACALSVVMAVLGLVLHLIGLPFATSGSQVLTLFTLVFIVVYKEVNYEAIMEGMDEKTTKIVDEIAVDRQVMNTLAKNYEEMARAQRQETHQALGQIKEATAEIKQVVADGASAATDPARTSE